MIWRHLTTRIKTALEDFPAVILTGARQVGKSTLAQSLLRDWPATYITLDDRLSLDSALRDPDGFLAANPTPLVIDEVQRAPDLFRALKRRIDKDREPGLYLLTGSANLMRLPQVRETLAGRVALLELHPFSWLELNEAPPSPILSKAFSLHNAAELLGTLPNQTTDRWKEIIDRIVAGSYPVPALMQSQEARSQWYASYRQTYVERDIRDLAAIEHVPDFNRLLRLVAARTGRLLNKADLSRDSGLAYATLNRYLNMMEVTYQVRQTHPFYANITKRLVKTPKIYLTDSGMAAHLLSIDDWRSAEALGLAGQLVETWVENELVKLISAVDPLMELMFWRTGLGDEVDFVVMKGQDLLAVEVKSSRTVTTQDVAGLQTLARDLGNRVRMCFLLYAGTEVVAVDQKTVALPFGAFFGIDRP